MPETAEDESAASTVRISSVRPINGQRRRTREA
jgi:hypothetical protein